MRSKLTFGVVVAFFTTVFAVTIWALLTQDIAILRPSGSIADQERRLLIIATLLMLIVVIPVFFMLFAFAWKYRAGNKKSKYHPNWDHNHKIEALWWGIPFIIILVLATITWVTSYRLDPFRAINSAKTPIKIQVVALQWKWLFLYPEENIATVNHFIIPQDTPVEFEITAAAPMNSFWIPKLGGQIYAMEGMSTKLHLVADEPGVYRGVSANISGEGFAEMNFDAEAVPVGAYRNWLETMRINTNHLGFGTYKTLSAPSKQDNPLYYGSFFGHLYDTIIDEYMRPPLSGLPTHESGHDEASTEGLSHDGH